MCCLYIALLLIKTFLKAIMHLEKVSSVSFYGLRLCVDVLFQGIATREGIDTTLKLGMNHPMGPLQLGALTQVKLEPI